MQRLTPFFFSTRSYFLHSKSKGLNRNPLPYFTNQLTLPPYMPKESGWTHMHHLHIMLEAVTMMFELRSGHSWSVSMPVEGFPCRRLSMASLPRRSLTFWFQERLPPWIRRVTRCLAYVPIHKPTPRSSTTYIPIRNMRLTPLPTLTPTGLIDHHLNPSVVFAFAIGVCSLDFCKITPLIIFLHRFCASQKADGIVYSF